jgi:hypothetical protein
MQIWANLEGHLILLLVFFEKKKKKKKGLQFCQKGQKWNYFEVKK